MARIFVLFLTFVLVVPPFCQSDEKGNSMQSNPQDGTSWTGSIWTTPPNRDKDLEADLKTNDLIKIMIKEIRDLKDITRNNGYRQPYVSPSPYDHPHVTYHYGTQTKVADYEKPKNPKQDDPFDVEALVKAIKKYL